MKKTTATFLLLCWLGGSGRLLAQQVLTLPGAIQAALQRNYDIQMAGNDAAVGQANYLAAKGAQLPQVNLTASDNYQLNNLKQKYTTGSDVVKDGVPANATAVGATASVVLFNGMRLQALGRENKFLALASTASLTATVQYTISQVIGQYYQVVRQQEYLKNLDRDNKLYQDRLDLTRQMKDNGLASQADVNTAQIDLDQNNQARQEQAQLTLEARADLYQLLHFRADTALAISDTIRSGAPTALDVILKQLPASPEYAVYTCNTAALEQNLEATKGLRYPNLRLNAGYNFSLSQTAAGFTLLNQSYGPFAGITLNAPLYTGGVARQEQQVARLDYLNTQLKQEQAMSQMQTDAYKSWTALQSDRQQITLQREMIAAADQNLSLETERYKLRVSGLLELRTAQQQRDAIFFKLTDLEYQAKLEEIELYRLTGQLSPSSY